MRTPTLAALFATSAGIALADDVSAKCAEKGLLSYVKCPMREHDFTAFYAGLHLGVGGVDLSGEFDQDGAEPVIPKGFDFEDEVNGLTGGVHFGYSRHLDNDVVIGFEIDGSVADATTEQSDAAGAGLKGDVDYFGSARLRLGYAFESLMPYMTGGVGVVGYSLKATDDAGASVPAADFDSQAIAAVFGGGFEYIVDDGLSLRIEGLYYAVDDKISVSNAHYGVDHVRVDDLWTVRAGITFRF